MNKNITTEIVISASREKVWNIITDFSNYRNWNPFIINIDGLLAENAILTNTMLNNGKKMVFRPRVLKVIPNQYFDWMGHLFVRGVFDGHHFFELKELPEGRVQLKHGENFSGVLSGYILGKIGEDTRNNFIKMNEAIKNLAEEK
jgi:hypothetical protein